MKRTVAVALFAVVGAAALAASNPQSPQLPARDGVSARGGTPMARFAIRGRVLAADTSLPVRRAMVRLASSQLNEGRAALTDADGKYEFGDLPAGSYYISASKTGFLAAMPGNELAGMDGEKSIRLGDGGNAETPAVAKDIALTRAGAIAGRVLDEMGDPLGNATVRLLRIAGGARRPTTFSQYQAGSGALVAQQTGIFVTNDLGQYRASGLMPGTYLIFAESVRGANGEIGDQMWYAPTYYPGTVDPSAAAPVLLSAGQEMAGADITIALVRMARVSGTVVDSLGRPASDARVGLQLAQSAVGFMSVGNYARVQPNGTFTITGVGPGDYWLTATLVQSGGSGSAPRRVEHGRVRIAVAGGDVTGLTLPMNGGATVSGEVVFEGAPPKGRLTVTTMSDATGDMAGLMSESLNAAAGGGLVAADGAFVLPGVFGDRVFRLNGLPAGWAIKTVYVSGRDMTDTAVSLDGREQLTGVHIVVTDRITHVTATITDEGGQPAERGAWVFIVPEDPEKSARPGSRFVRSTAVPENGAAKIDGLPPGDYVAVAFRQSPRNIDVYAADVLEQIRKTGMKFTLREAEARDITLKLGERAGTQ